MQRLLGNSHANGEAQLPATAKPPRLPITPLEGEEVHGNTLDYYTTVASAIYCRVSNAFLKASPPFQQTFPIPNINHRISGFCGVSSWGTESSSAWLIFNSTTAALFFPDPPTPLMESLMPALILWRALQHQERCTDRTALSTHWNEPPKQDCVYRHNAVGAVSRRRAWKHCTNSCSNIPQGYMQNHIHSGFFACKWFMGTRMLPYCLFKTHCNSSGYFIENQH